jgi:PAS domain S-box-containing protein
VSDLRAHPGGASLANELHEIVDASPHGIVLLDLEGLVLDLNPAMERLLDHRRDEVVGHPCGPFTHPADHEAEWPLLEAVLLGESDGYTIEKRYVRRGGDTVWARLDLRLIRGDDGRPLRLLALIENVDEHRRRTDELERRVALLEAAERAGGLGSFEWAAADDRVTWSDELCRILGVDPGTAPAGIASILERVHPDDRETARQAFEHAVAVGTPFRLELRAVRPDGEDRQIACRGGVLRDDGGAVRLVAACHDVTGQRASGAG